MININITKVTPDLFNKDAEEAARICSMNNTPTQLRRFYDELEMWNDKVTKVGDSSQGKVPCLEESEKKRQEEFENNLPYIRMMCAKVAYAKGRGLVDGEFYELYKRIISQIVDIKTLQTAKIFMEAFMGFLKYYVPTKR